jgi:hypothetical protein
LAIGSVSRFLSGALTTALWNVPPYNPKITVQRPQADAPGTATQPRINLFLYEAEIDAAMRNVGLTLGGQPPLWMVLKYVMTAFDGNGESDTPESHDLLGMGMQVLAGIGDALPALMGYTALSDNPEPLKVSFDQATPDLIARLMQGPDDKYRCSAAFQVRPVLIAQPQLPTGMQLVGIDYQLGIKIGLAGIQNFVLPTLGPELENADPQKVELGDTLALSGRGLGEPGISINFGPLTFVPSMQKSTRLEIFLGSLDPARISAGNISVSATQELGNGVQISSGAVNVVLLPTIATMTIASIAKVSSINLNVYGTITLTGVLLGNAGDSLELAFVQNGLVKLLLDGHDPAFTPVPDQTQQQFDVAKEKAIPQGAYFVVLRVNGQQAKQAFTLNMVTP